MSRTKKQTVSITRMDDLRYVKQHLETKTGTPQSLNQAADFAIRTAMSVATGNMETYTNSVTIGKVIGIFRLVANELLPGHSLSVGTDEHGNVTLHIDNKGILIANCQINEDLVTEELEKFGFTMQDVKETKH